MRRADTVRRWCFVLLAVAVVAYFVVEAVGAAAWPNPGYSYANNYVSDLGVPPAASCGEAAGRFVCSPRYAVVNAEFFLLGFATLVGLLAYASTLTGARRVVTLVFAIAQGVGIAMVGVAPGSFAEDLTNDRVQMAVHSLGALLAIVGTALHAIVAGVWELCTRGGSRPFGILSLALGAVTPLALALQAVTGIPDLALGRGTFERLGVYAAMAWLGVVAVCGWRASRSSAESARMVA